MTVQELKLWSVGESGGAEPVQHLSQMPTEWEFEETLVSTPEMLEPGVKLVGRQTPVAGGWLDLLAVDDDGRLVVYELKRGKLARDAVTQILDYASALDSMTGRCGPVTRSRGADRCIGLLGSASKGPE